MTDELLDLFVVFKLLALHMILYWSKGHNSGGGGGVVRLSCMERTERLVGTLHRMFMMFSIVHMRKTVSETLSVGLFK
jgi:hypothetical protein